MTDRPPKTAVGYRGGKTARNASGVGRWIASLLPLRGGYCEPYAGMLGILLQRPPVRTEIANDADGFIVNWWRCIRDAPDDFTRLLSATPLSRAEFDRCREVLDEPLPEGWTARSPANLRLGLAAHVVMAQSILKATGARRWLSSFDSSKRGGGHIKNPPDAARLSRRIESVQLECGDGAALIRRAGEHADCVIYADPPYAGTKTPYYSAESSDPADLADALRAAKGPTAISGYGDEWDCLGWMRHEHAEAARIGPFHGGEGGRRIHVLWTNYAPERRGGLFG